MATATKKTSTRIISLINVCLRYMSAVANVEKKMKYNSALKYDEYSLIETYKLASALQLVVDFKTDGRIDFHVSIDQTSATLRREGMDADARAFAINFHMEISKTYATKF